MIDFTSSLYLGIKHSKEELAAWSQLTTGAPAALFELKESRDIGNYLAHMQGFQKGLVAPSTLHLYYDLFGFLSKQRITAFIDDKIYTVSKFGIERLIVKNIPVYTFRHLNSGDLFKLVSKKLQRLTKPVVFTDGFCPQCGKIAPIEEYNLIIKSFDGKIIIDDTQAFGILGKREDVFAYGYGGGGTLQWLNTHNENIVTITSLAKAFGVPMAVISGSEDFIYAFEKSSVTRESSSPVSLVHLSAANNAIIINNNSGDKRRKKLLNNIFLIQKELEHAPLKLNGSLFPVQSIVNLNYDDTMRLFEKLNQRNLKTVLTQSHIGQKPVITFIINCDHSVSQIRSLANAIKQQHDLPAKSVVI